MPLEQVNKFENIQRSKFFTGDSPFRFNVQVKNPKLFVITGDNATGKSLLRKLLYLEYEDAKTLLIHTSQAARCRGGVVRGFMYGSEEDDSTGFNTIKTIQGVIKTARSKDAEGVKYGILLDEPEIGCGEELQAMIGFHLQQQLQQLTHLEECYIITHSRVVVKSLFPSGPSHIRLMQNQHDYISLTDWVNRKISLYDDSLDEVLKRGRKGWNFILDLKQKRDKERQDG